MPLVGGEKMEGGVVAASRCVARAVTTLSVGNGNDIIWFWEAGGGPFHVVGTAMKRPE